MNLTQDGKNKKQKISVFKLSEMRTSFKGETMKSFTLLFLRKIPKII